MQNKYIYIDYSHFGIPLLEIKGNTFSYLDLYELVGQQRFTVTFNFKSGSEAQAQYGKSVTGVINYDFKTTQKLNTGSIEDGEVDLSRIKINVLAFDLSTEALSELKYGGIKVADIESILFIPHQKDPEKYDTGEKKVPNKIEIPLDTQNADIDKIRQSYLIDKNNSGVELIGFEKEQLLGTMLALNDNRIDVRVLAHFGFTVDSIKEARNVWYYNYEVRERRGILSDEEKLRFSEVQDIRKIQRLTILMQELLESRATEEELAPEILKEIVNLIMKFSPSILVHGKKQIYWDENSYIHILLRHIKDFQVGSFKRKTTFPYKLSDLESIIERVLMLVKDEYKMHRSQNPTSPFTRAGSMAVTFNGDHYHLKIESDGRLSQFHIKSAQENIDASA